MIGIDRFIPTSKFHHVNVNIDSSERSAGGSACRPWAPLLMWSRTRLAWLKLGLEVSIMKSWTGRLQHVTACYNCVILFDNLESCPKHPKISNLWLVNLVIGTHPEIRWDSGCGRWPIFMPKRARSSNVALSWRWNLAHQGTAKIWCTPSSTAKLWKTPPPRAALVTLVPSIWGDLDWPKTMKPRWNLGGT